MIRTRQHNVTAAQWSSNGDALGRIDLTEPENNPFAANVFSQAVQRERLDSGAYERLQESIASDELMDPDLADQVAAAMKEWALERGATHFTHMFQPLTGSTAEKHDSFFAPAPAPSEPPPEDPPLTDVLTQPLDPVLPGRGGK